jgi:predicted ATPase with chaperone activity
MDMKLPGDILSEPKRLEDLMIPHSILIDIILRALYSEGNVEMRRLSQITRIPTVLEDLMDWLRREHLVEISQTASSFGPLNYIYKLTNSGEERAKEAMERSQYIGPAPVPVHFYSQMIELQTQGTRQVTISQVKKALSDLILPEDFHRRIGPAVLSGTSLFLYGPSGNGKTTIAQKVAQLISGMDPIWLPYSITAGGQIIQIHDRLFHSQVERSKNKAVDGRWGLFHRPSVVVGGELKMDALDLRYDPVARIYEAPLQLKANGGMFLIDDFGRQQVSPVDLLNRWIVPLENGVDYLRLRTGQTIVVPFRQLIVFSTNLDPYKLADDAFYRRIQMKVGVFSPDEERFRSIFLKVCQQIQLDFDDVTFNHLLEKWYRQSNRLYQAVHPRDLLKIVRALCEYEGISPQMRPDLMDEACASYFVVS